MITKAVHPLVNPLTLIRWPANVSNLFVSSTSCTLATLLCLLTIDQCQHWFIIPVMLCGILTGLDALKWLRGEVDVFDPLGILGLVCFHVYFVAPLLHFYYDSWMPFIEPPDDWRPWVGEMAWLNLAGWCIYLAVRSLLERWLPRPTTKTYLQIEPRRFIPLVLVTLVGSAAMQGVVYISFGGIVGFMETYAEAQPDFVGKGWLFILAELFPIVAVFGVIYWLRRSAYARSWPVIIALLVGFFVVKMLFGGLRGSRGHTIYGLFWVAGIIHLMLRPIPRKFIFAAALLMFGFMYIYLYYKTYGHEALEALEAGSSELESSHRSSASIFLGDFGRTDIQAFVLYRLSPECPVSEYECVYGETYLGAAALVIPSAILPDKPPSKIKAGTDALFGYGVFENLFKASNAYGLPGEAMLNFGPIGVPLSFVVLGVVVVFTRRLLWKYPPGDSRRFLVPFGISLSYMIFMWDSDIVLFYIIKEGFIPSLVVLLGSNSIPLAARQTWEARE